METEDISPGMVVRIISWNKHRPDHWEEYGEMDGWRGAVVTIAEVMDSEEIYLEDDEGQWQWYAWDFEPFHVLPEDDPNMKYKRHKRENWMRKMKFKPGRYSKGYRSER